MTPNARLVIKRAQPCGTHISGPHHRSMGTLRDRAERLDKEPRTEDSVRSSPQRRTSTPLVSAGTRRMAGIQVVSDDEEPTCRTAKDTLTLALAALESLHGREAGVPNDDEEPTTRKHAHTLMGVGATSETPKAPAAEKFWPDPPVEFGKGTAAKAPAPIQPALPCASHAAPLAPNAPASALLSTSTLPLPPKSTSTLSAPKSGAEPALVRIEPEQPGSRTARRARVNIVALVACVALIAVLVARMTVTPRAAPPAAVPPRPAPSPSLPIVAAPAPQTPAAPAPSVPRAAPPRRERTSPVARRVALVRTSGQAAQSHVRSGAPAESGEDSGDTESEEDESVAPASRTAAPMAPLREVVSREEALQAIESMRPALERCTGGRAASTAMDVTITFAGSGRVTTATIGLPFAGTPVGSCMALALRSARVQPFARPSYQLVTSFRLH